MTLILMCGIDSTFTELTQLSQLILCNKSLCEVCYNTSSKLV